MSFDFNDINQVKKMYQDKLEAIKDVEKDFKKLGKEVATAEKEYKKSLQQAFVKLKIDGEAVTLIKKLAEGRTSDQFYTFKIAEVNFNAYKANLKRLYSNIDFLRSLLSAAKSEINIR